MSASKSRYVSVCQQALTLLAVVAVLAPAANVISLDITHAPEVAPTVPIAAGPGDEAPVETAPVEATVEEVALTATEDAVPAEPALPGSAERAPAPDEAATGEPTGEPTSEPTAPATTDAEGLALPGVTTELLADPQPVTGFGAVGVTWDPATPVAGDEITFQVRTATAGEWSDWEPIPYEAEAEEAATAAENAAGPVDAEEASARPGTELVFVGEVDEAQVQVVAPGGLPADLTVAVIDPGTSDVVEEAPEYEAAAPITTGTTGTTGTSDADEAGTDQIALQAASSGVSQPSIYSRAQWGADERMRDGAPRYAAVKGAVIHHTVNANNYTAAQVPGIIRGIYAYHTKSQGWADIGYNFLVDKFGRLWEGRYGGITKAVRGAHIAAYNDYTFGISAIGNYETAQPTQQMLDAIAHLIAWKLRVHGIDATSTQSFGGARYPAIIGHRDGGQTACPGKYLYAKLGWIRTEAKRIQTSGGSTTPTPPPTPGSSAARPAIASASLIGGAQPDLVFRQPDGRVWILPTGGLNAYGTRVPVGTFPGAQGVTISPDLTGDGKPDLVVVDSRGVAFIYPGTGANGRFGAPRTVSPGMFKGTENLIGVGDLNGDGKNDLIARFKATGKTVLYLGDGAGKFSAVEIARDWRAYSLFTVIGDLTGDGVRDIVAKDTAGKMWVIPTGVRRTGNVRQFVLGQRISVPGDFSAVAAMGGWGDVNADGRSDLLLRLSSGSLYLMPYNGGVARFGPTRGPLAGGGAFRELSSAGNLIGSTASDLVGRIGDTVYVVPHAGTVDHYAAKATNIVVPEAAAIFNVGDWDKDGKGDIVTRAADGALTLWRGDGQGSFADGIALGSGFGDVTKLRFIGDVTGDGLPDFYGRNAAGAPTIFPGNGTAGFKPSISASKAMDEFWYFRGMDLSAYDLVTATASLTGRTTVDVILRHKSSGILRLLQWNAAGQVVTNRTIAEPSKNINALG
ncbi:MAG TPA: FG-GAP-like repeat-containing protein [Nocardioides sp.]